MTAALIAAALTAWLAASVLAGLAVAQVIKMGEEV